MLQSSPIRHGKLKPLVVGYRGEIGSFICERLFKYLPKVTDMYCFDVIETERQKVERIKKADVIFLCVPLWETVNWLYKYKKHLRGKIIVEQTSLKRLVYMPNCDLRDLTIVSMHLLFRPSATPEDERSCGFFTDQWNGKHGSVLREISLMIKCGIHFYKGWQQHDTRMALEQTLVHRTLIYLDQMIGKDPGTFISKQVHKMAQRISKMDSRLFNNIQGNHDGFECVKELQDLLKYAPTLDKK